MLTKTIPPLLADFCWVGLALLSREQPSRESFTAREIRDRLYEEWGEESLRPGVQPHIYQHAVANVEPSAGRYRLLYKLSDGTFRLFRPGDDYHPQRSGKTVPQRADLPPEYHDLLDWYEASTAQRGKGEDEDPLMRLWGLGSEIWQGIDPDAYVRELREGWEDTPRKDSRRGR